MEPQEGDRLMAKRDEIFRGGMATLGLTFNREITGPLMDGYWLVLEGLSEIELSKAFGRALAESRFMPVPVELLTFAGRAPSTPEADAVEAWSVVRACIDSIDYTGSADFGPLVNAVLWNMGGWQRLCDLKVSELEVWAKKDFERVYLELSTKDVTRLRCEPHIGFLREKPRRIAIGGKMPPLALPAVASPVADVVRDLADAKSEPKEFDIPVGSGPAPQGIPPRPEKPKAAAMTEADVAARKAQINAQMAARGVTL